MKVKYLTEHPDEKHKIIVTLKQSSCGVAMFVGEIQILFLSDDGYIVITPGLKPEDADDLGLRRETNHNSVRVTYL